MAVVRSPGADAQLQEQLLGSATDPVGMAHSSAPVGTSCPGQDCVADACSSETKDGGGGSTPSADGMAAVRGGENETSVRELSDPAWAPRAPFIDLTEAEAEAQEVRAGDSEGQRELEWSAPDDESRERTVLRESYAPEIRSAVSLEVTPGKAQESVLSVEGGALSPQELEWRATGLSKELEGRESGGTRGEMQAKQRKSRLVCRECGKRFTRRETFNLHRHFHTHQDELASLTCKDCGLTFQHRSSLIKHRSEHKEKALLAGLEKRPHGREGRSLQCEHCAETFPTLGKLRCHPCQRAPEKPYRCPLCRREFQYRVSVNTHMQTHSLDTPFRCLECNKGFPCGLTLRIHQRSHAALKPFECPDCGMVFRHRSVMEDHRRKHAEERTHQCNLCGKCFKYSSLLHQHQFLHTGRKPFRCPDCGKTFAFAQNMRAHWRQHRKCTHHCLRCSLSFLDLTSLQAHMLSHGTVEVSATRMSANSRSGVQRINSCPLCPLTFPDVASLKAHMLIHEADEAFGGRGRGTSSNGEGQDGTLACPCCHVTLSDQRSLEIHMVSHVTPQQATNALSRVAVNNGMEALTGNWVDPLNRKMLKCVECGKTFRHRSVLELHMRIHSRDKPFQCKVCGKAFKFSSYLQQHLIIHTGQKPFKCPDCGKDFAFLQNMKTHQRLHQQKPYRCTQCRKGYSEEGELQRHMVSHTGDKPHKCQLCDKSFGLAYLLRDHLNTHTGERPHRCSECHKSFPWLSSLLVHQKIHARKRQGLGQPFSLPLAPQRGRGRARGTRGRRGSRWASSWPRWAGGEGMAPPSSLLGYAGQISREQDWHRRRAVDAEPPFFIPHLDICDQWRQQQQHWQSKAQDRPVPQEKQPVSWASAARSSPVVRAAVQYEDSYCHQADGTAAWGLKTHPVTNQSVSHLEKSGHTQKQQQNLTWASRSASTQVAQLAVQFDETCSRGSEKATVWTLKKSPTVAQNPQDNPADGQKQQQHHVSCTDTPRLTAESQPAVHYEESHPCREERKDMLGSPAPPVQPQTLSPSEKSGGGPKQEQALGRVSTSTSTQGSQASALIHEPQSPEADGTVVQGIQTSPAVTQTLSRATKQQQHSGEADSQGPTKPPTSVTLSPTQCSHSDADGTLAPSSQNSYLTQQNVISEEPTGSQMLPPVQATQPAETFQQDGALHCAVLPFAPNPLLQCMICGCSLPRELDLHMHYMQHAQGDI